MSYNIDEFMINKIEMDEEFEFGCNGCGKCCHRDTLILTGYDIFRIAKYLNKTTEEIIKENCFTYIGDDSKLPIVSIKPRTGDKSCRFLRVGKCVVNQAKPTVCSIYPMGRIYDSRINDYVYFRQEVGCGNKEKHTLKEWLEDINIAEINSMSVPWGNALLELAKYMQTIKEKEKLRVVVNAIFIALYLNYDISRGYEEQVEYNLSELEKYLPKFKRNSNKG